jgi:hypothetical protein
MMIDFDTDAILVLVLRIYGYNIRSLKFPSSMLRLW